MSFDLFHVEFIRADSKANTVKQQKQNCKQKEKKKQLSVLP